MWRQQNTANPLCGDSRTPLTLCVVAAEHILPFVWWQQNTPYPLYGGRRTQLILCVAAAEHRQPFVWRQQNTAYPLCGGALSPKTSDTSPSICTLSSRSLARSSTRMPFSTKPTIHTTPLSLSLLVNKQQCIWWLFPHMPGSSRSKTGSLHTTGVYCGKDTAVSTLLESTVGRTRQSPHYWSLLWEGHGSLRSIWVYCGKDSAVSTLLGSTAERTC